MHELTLHIDGMSCGHCIRSVKQALEETSGITVKQVDVGTATVDYDGRPESLDAIVKAVEDAGYAARPESDTESEVHGRSDQHHR